MIREKDEGWMHTPFAVDEGCFAAAATGSASGKRERQKGRLE